MNLADPRPVDRLVQVTILLAIENVGCSPEAA
jgi:hypothetical protein